MGDTGSILLGFVFASMVTWLSDSLVNFLCLVSFLFLFYADEITSSIIRLKDGENLWTPHRRHLYQILANEYGVAHWKVSLGYGLAQLFVGARHSVFFKTRAYDCIIAIFSLLCGLFFDIAWPAQKVKPKCGI